jgi:hypothetical protein
VGESPLQTDRSVCFETLARPLLENECCCTIQKNNLKYQLKNLLKAVLVAYFAGVLLFWFFHAVVSSRFPPKHFGEPGSSAEAGLRNRMISQILEARCLSWLQIS